MGHQAKHSSAHQTIHIARPRAARLCRTPDPAVVIFKVARGVGLCRLRAGDPQHLVRHTALSPVPVFHLSHKPRY